MKNYYIVTFVIIIKSIIMVFMANMRFICFCSLLCCCMILCAIFQPFSSIVAMLEAHRGVTYWISRFIILQLTFVLFLCMASKVQSQMWNA